MTQQDTTPAMATNYIISGTYAGADANSRMKRREIIMPDEVKLEKDIHYVTGRGFDCPSYTYGVDQCGMLNEATVTSSTGAYTVREIDELRKCCSRKLKYGAYNEWPYEPGQGLIYSNPASQADIEEMVRTHMIAGHTAQDLLDSEAVDARPGGT